MLEYKGEHDVLSLMKFYQYSLIELGILTTHLLSKERKDRTERQPLSVKASQEQWKQLKSKGAKHGCCTVILSTTDPKSLREEVGFQAVDTYEHLDGALYRVMIDENSSVGSIATYLVIINHLPIHPKNAPLLLLSKGRKLTEFFQWLLEDDEEVAIQERQTYLYYLAKYGLASIPEGVQEMKYQTLDSDQLLWLVGIIAQMSKDGEGDFYNKLVAKMLQSQTSFDIFQNADAKDKDEIILRSVENKEQLDRINRLYEERAQQV